MMKNIFIAAIAATSLIPISGKAINIDGVKDSTEHKLNADDMNIIDNENTKILTIGRFQLSFSANENKNKNKIIRKHYKNNLPTFYISYAQINSANSLSKSNALSQAGSSYELGTYFHLNDFSLNNRGTFGISTCLGLSRTSFRFSNNNVIYTDAANNMVFGKLTDHPELTKSWLRYWSLRLPLTIGYRNRHFGMSVGPELEWRLKCRSRIKYDNNEYTILENPDVTPIAVNMLMNISCGNVCILGRLCLTDFMTIHTSDIKSGTNFKVTPFVIGIGIGL